MSSTSGACTPISGSRWRRQAWLARPDLRILVMSATLDTAPVATFLGGCPVIDVPGTLHPLTMDYAPGESVADALRHVLPVTRGNVLCFLPGAREIGATIAAADSLARTSDVDIVPLHGSLDAAEQDAALAGESQGGRSAKAGACLAEARSAKAGHRGDQRR